jgi:hypothetical protein
MCTAMSESESQTIVECVQTYLGTRCVTVGTRAAMIGGSSEGQSAKLRITEPKQGTELQIGEVYDLPASDLQQFWVTLPSLLV